MIALCCKIEDGPKDVVTGEILPCVVVSSKAVCPEKSADPHACRRTTACKLEECPEIEIALGAKYRGQWYDRQCHGKGELRMDDGSWYKGEFLMGGAHGYGQLVARETTYEGEWHADKAHGYGTYTHLITGSSYTGQWQSDEKWGHGTESFKDGSTFRGEYIAGCKHGEGVYLSASGEIVYKGTCNDDLMHGHGIYYFQDGRTYTGEWCRGHMHGTGVMNMADRSRYVGDYTYDVRHGEGVFHYADGRRYNGQWRHGVPDGIGKVTGTDCWETVCKFEEGKMVWEYTQSLRLDGNDNDDDNSDDSFIKDLQARDVKGRITATNPYVSGPVDDLEPGRLCAQRFDDHPSPDWDLEVAHI